MPKWTMIFLIRCLQEPAQITNCVRMLEDLLSLEIPDDRAVLIWLNMDVTAVNQVDATYVPPVSAVQGTVTSRFYKMEKDPQARGSRKSKLVWLGNNMNNISITSAGDVEQFFTQYVVQPGYTGDNNVLFTWGHGMPYGVFWGSGAPDPGQEYDMLNGVRLKDAIIKSFSGTGKKIDVLIMMNCYIQFFDFAYCMEEAGVDYLVGAPAGNTYVGLNYSVIFPALFSDTPTPIKPSDLASLAVDSIRQSGSDEAGRVSHLTETTVYANSLSGYTTELAGLVNQLGTALIAEIPGNFSKIVSALTNMDTINNIYHVIDFFSFVRSLRQHFTDQWQKPLMDNIQAQQGLHFTASFIGDDVPASGYYPSGFLICLPDHSTVPGFFVFYQMYFEYGGNPSYLSPFVGGDWSKFVKQFISFDPARDKVS